MDARGFLASVGSGVQAAFAEQRSILSFEEYLDGFMKAPRLQARGAAQWLKDAVEHFGSEELATPVGRLRRWRLFDLPFAPEAASSRVAGHEEVQASVVRILGNFVRSGRADKLILLHGPNGSAKSTIVAALVRAMEAYSRMSEGALYRYNWVFPSEKRVRGGGTVGFGGGGGAAGDPASYAYLEGDAIDARLACPLRDHPLLLVPRAERRRLLEERCQPASRGGAGEGDFVLADAVADGEPCPFCQQIVSALLGAYHGDYLRVLRHVQVERFYVSARYQQAAVAVEPQLSVDASVRQISADRSAASLPAALQSVALLEPFGPLVAANRGLLEYADLLKRPLETFKYLLGTSETGRVSLETLILHLDLVLVASANEKQLAAFKETPEFQSFRGRIELVRVPYLRRRSVERAIYDQQVTTETAGKHIAPHATDVGAVWAVLTRLKKPQADRYPAGLRAVVDGLTPLEKLRLYDQGTAPDRLGLAQARDLRARLQEMFRESDVYPIYEGRTGASAREIKTAIFNAAQSPRYRCLTPMAVLQELTALCRDVSVHEFLQQEVVGGYHDHAAFVTAAEGELLDTLDEEIRDSMGLVPESQYRELFDRYVALVSSWVKGERVRNRVTGAYEQPDEERMAEFERIVMTARDDRNAFRRSLISAIGAYRVDHPEGSIDTAAIFPDLFRRLRDHYFEERRRELQRNKENVLHYLSDERGMLDDKARRDVERTLAGLRDKYGYCEHCAQDAVLFLLRKRYED
ncbi:MAG TPA: serine protein kinase PrkA [Anaeromyxobacteraceae bacterium]|jgi:predicted Ser/Thr protein kinase